MLENLSNDILYNIFESLDYASCLKLKACSKNLNNVFNTLEANIFTNSIKNDNVDSFINIVRRHKIHPLDVLQNINSKILFLTQAINHNLRQYEVEPPHSSYGKGLLDRDSFLNKILAKFCLRFKCNKIIKFLLTSIFEPYQSMFIYVVNSDIYEDLIQMKLIDDISDKKRVYGNSYYPNFGQYVDYNIKTKVSHTQAFEYLERKYLDSDISPLFNLINSDSSNKAFTFILKDSLPVCLDGNGEKIENTWCKDMDKQTILYKYLCILIRKLFKNDIKLNHGPHLQSDKLNLSFTIKNSKNQKICLSKENLNNIQEFYDMLIQNSSLNILQINLNTVLSIVNNHNDSSISKPPSLHRDLTVFITDILNNLVKNGDLNIIKYFLQIVRKFLNYKNNFDLFSDIQQNIQNYDWNGDEYSLIPNNYSNMSNVSDLIHVALQIKDQGRAYNICKYFIRKCKLDLWSIFGGYMNFSYLLKTTALGRLIEETEISLNTNIYHIDNLLVVLADSNEYSFLNYLLARINSKNISLTLENHGEISQSYVCSFIRKGEYRLFDKWINSEIPNPPLPNSPSTWINMLDYLDTFMVNPKITLLVRTKIIGEIIYHTSKILAPSMYQNAENNVTILDVLAIKLDKNDELMFGNIGGGGLNVTDSSGRNLLHHLAITPHSIPLMEYVEKKVQNVHWNINYDDSYEVDVHCGTPFFQACKYGTLDNVKYLLKKITQNFEKVDHELFPEVPTKLVAGSALDIVLASSKNRDPNVFINVLDFCEYYKLFLFDLHKENESIWNRKTSNYLEENYLKNILTLILDKSSTSNTRLYSKNQLQIIFKKLSYLFTKCDENKINIYTDNHLNYLLNYLTHSSNSNTYRRKNIYDNLEQYVIEQKNMFNQHKDIINWILNKFDGKNKRIYYSNFYSIYLSLVSFLNIYHIDQDEIKVDNILNKSSKKTVDDFEMVLKKITIKMVDKFMILDSDSPLDSNIENLRLISFLTNPYYVKSSGLYPELYDALPEHLSFCWNNFVIKHLVSKLKNSAISVLEHKSKTHIFRDLIWSIIYHKLYFNHFSSRTLPKVRSKNQNGEWIAGNGYENNNYNLNIRHSKSNTLEYSPQLGSYTYKINYCFEKYYNCELSNCQCHKKFLSDLQYILSKHMFCGGVKCDMLHKDFSFLCVQFFDIKHRKNIEFENLYDQKYDKMGKHFRNNCLYYGKKFNLNIDQYIVSNNLLAGMNINILYPVLLSLYKSLNSFDTSFNSSGFIISKQSEDNSNFDKFKNVLSFIRKWYLVKKTLKRYVEYFKYYKESPWYNENNNQNQNIFSNVIELKSDIDNQQLVTKNELTTSSLEKPEFVQSNNYAQIINIVKNSPLNNSKNPVHIDPIHLVWLSYQNSYLSIKADGIKERLNSEQYTSFKNTFQKEINNVMQKIEELSFFVRYMDCEYIEKDNCYLFYNYYEKEILSKCSSSHDQAAAMPINFYKIFKMFHANQYNNSKKNNCQSGLNNDNWLDPFSTQSYSPQSYTTQISDLDYVKLMSEINREKFEYTEFIRNNKNKNKPLWWPKKIWKLPKGAKMIKLLSELEERKINSGYPNDGFIITPLVDTNKKGRNSIPHQGLIGKLKPSWEKTIDLKYISPNLENQSLNKALIKDNDNFDFLFTSDNKIVQNISPESASYLNSLNLQGESIWRCYWNNTLNSWEPRDLRPEKKKANCSVLVETIHKEIIAPWKISDCLKIVENTDYYQNIDFNKIIHTFKEISRTNKMITKILLDIEIKNLKHLKNIRYSAKPNCISSTDKNKSSGCVRPLKSMCSSYYKIKVLDLGCGKSNISNKFKDVEWYGLDKDPLCIWDKRKYTGKWICQDLNQKWNFNNKFNYNVTEENTQTIEDWTHLDDLNILKEDEQFDIFLANFSFHNAFNNISNIHNWLIEIEKKVSNTNIARGCLCGDCKVNPSQQTYMSGSTMLTPQNAQYHNVPSVFYISFIDFDKLLPLLLSNEDNILHLDDNNYIELINYENLDNYENTEKDKNEFTYTCKLKYCFEWFTEPMYESVISQKKLDALMSLYKWNKDPYLYIDKDKEDNICVNFADKYGWIHPTYRKNDYSLEPQENKPILVQTKLDNIKSTEGWKNYMKCHTWVKYTKFSFSPIIVID